MGYNAHKQRGLIFSPSLFFSRNFYWLFNEENYKQKLQKEVLFNKKGETKL